MFPSDNDLDFKITMESDTTLVSEDIPFHILILGDWSSRENRVRLGHNELESQLIEIDRDNFDEVLKNFNVKLDLDLNQDGQNIISLQLTELDDFHPDKIFEQVAIFSALRSLRQRLLKPETFQKAAAEVRSWFETDIDENFSRNRIQNEQPVKTHSSSAQLLDNILSKSEQTTSPEFPQTSDPTELSLFVSKLVKPFLIKTDEKEQLRLVSALDEAITVLMRKILHHPQFKELESAWRGLHFLVRGAETDLQLKIFLFDISKLELSSVLKSSNDSQQFSIFKILENHNSMALICGNYSFQINVDDIAALIRIAKISNTLNAPFVSHLTIETIDDAALTETFKFNNLIFASDSTEARLWNTIRAIPDAESVGLLIQRLLIRLPFGVETEPAENFSFEEFLNTASRKDYLWTNPCFAFALIEARSYSVYRWELGESLNLDIEDLPALVSDEAGTSEIIPACEFVMTEQLCEDILQLGLMPIINYRNTDKIRLAQIQSIAFPKKMLKGKWN